MLKLKIKKILRLTLIIFIILTPLIIPRLIKINDIECKTQYGECMPDINNGLKELKNRNYPQVKKGIKKLLKNEPSVYAYRINLKLPGHIMIILDQKKPLFALTSKEKKTFSNIDSNAEVISQSGDSSLPYVIISSDPPLKGTKVASGEIFALELMRDISTLYQISEGTLENDGLVIELPDNLRVIFPLEGDREALIGSLVLLHGEILKKDTSKFEFSSGSKKLLDLRYKNPVIKNI